jgi:cell division septal protein FtsQ
VKLRLRFPRPSRAARVAVSIVLGAAALWVGTPVLLRHLAFFRVRQVELVGVQHLAPDAVLNALRLPDNASVFDDTRRLADRVEGVAGVAAARVVRRVPGALKVLVTEVTPVAFVPGPRAGGLTVVDAHGRVLPYDPSRSGLDLPIAATADSGVLAVLAVIQSVDAALFQDITAARRSGSRGDVLLEWGTHRVLVRRDAGPEVIQAVVLVAQDLAARARPYTELDARYAGQIVVRRRAATGPKAGGGGGA